MDNPISKLVRVKKLIRSRLKTLSTNHTRALTVAEKHDVHDDQLNSFVSGWNRQVLREIASDLNAMLLVIDEEG